MAALDVMRRDLEAAQRGDWDTGFGFFADDSVLHVPAGRHWPAGTAAARPSSGTCAPPGPLPRGDGRGRAGR